MLNKNNIPQIYKVSEFLLHIVYEDVFVGARFDYFIRDIFFLWRLRIFISIILMRSHFTYWLERYAEI